MVDGRIYVVGGAQGLERAVARVESLDPVTGTWRSEADLTEGRMFPGVASAGGLLYAFGGIFDGETDFVTSMEVLGPRTGRWRFGASPPRGIDRVAAVSDGRKIYSVGGLTEGIENDPTILVFDTQTDTWDSLPPMSHSRHGAAAVILDDVLYVMGGYGPRPLGSVEAYDLSAGTWSEKASLLVPRGFAGAAAVNGRIYLYGGRVSDRRVVTEVYDPRTDSWTAAARIPEWRDRFASVAHEGKLYVIGGEANFGAGFGRKVLVYDVAQDRWSRLSRR